MNRIVDFVSGKLTYDEFEAMFMIDPSIWEVAQSLLTPEIMSNDQHPFWSKSNRNRLESNNYSVQYACLSFGYDSIGKIITHKMLSELVSFRYPDIIVREPPEISRGDLREKVGMEYLGGAEVDNLIDDILNTNSDGVSITKFISTVKQELRTRFHLVPRKYPRWIQEPEWPMGKESPMLFLSQCSCGELVEYHFQDMDTKEYRVVKQYY